MNAAQGTEPGTEREFTESVRPFLDDILLELPYGRKSRRPTRFAPVLIRRRGRKDFARWNRVREKLAAHQMPPPQAKQPDEAARRQVINWIDATWKSEARRNDGDPGPVLARRLSNAEYNYTIHDLTGVDIRPAKEFPVDPGESRRLRQLRRVADDVACPADEVSAGRSSRRRPYVPQPEWVRVRAASDAGRNRSGEILHPADRRFLRSATHRLLRLLPHGMDVQASGGVRQAQGDPRGHGRAKQSERAVPDDHLAGARRPERRRRSARKTADDVARAAGAGEGVRPVPRSVHTRCATSCCACERTRR